MTENVILQRFRGKRLLLDANVLLLYLIGLFDTARISRFKRTSDYSVEDFEKLAFFIGSFRSRVTTPHLLTEVNSLANSLPSYLRSAWLDHFRAEVASFLEVLEPAETIMHRSAFDPFGLADAAIQSIASDTLVVTNDFRLAGYLRSIGIETLSLLDVLAALEPR